MARIAITAASGLIGTLLQEHFRDAGHDVTRLVRSHEAAAAADAIYWSIRDGVVEASGLEGHDVVIHLSGENIRGLWTPAKKKRIRNSRVDSTRLLSETLARLDTRPHTLIVAGAAGYYGHRPGHELLDEAAAPGDSFLARVCVDWEAAADPARDAGIRVVHLRSGLVLTPRGSILAAALPLFRLGLGACFGDGSQMTPWVAYHEIPHVVDFLLEHDDVQGPVNLVAPHAVTNQEFTRTLGRVLHRPAFLKIPAFLMRLLGDLGRELLSGQHLVPRKLQDAGYAFRHPRLEGALRAELGIRGTASGPVSM